MLMLSIFSVHKSQKTGLKGYLVKVMVS